MMAMARNWLEKNLEKEPIVDVSVRKTLQIEPDQVILENPAWPKAPETIVQSVAEVLGVEPPLVQAHLYKLLLYEPGGFFKRHRYTEKTDGTDSEYACHYAARYADCEHEISKVESGYRLVLIYSLCYTGPRALSSSSLTYRWELSDILKRLSCKDPIFILPLEHQYTKSSLSLLGVSALKAGADTARQIALAAASNDLRMLIAEVDRTQVVSQGDDAEDYDDFSNPGEVVEGTPSIAEPYNAEGGAGDDWVEKCINFDTVEDGGMVLASKEHGLCWDDGDGGNLGYSGNEGCTLETIYKTCVLIVYKKAWEFNLTRK